MVHDTRQTPHGSPPSGFRSRLYPLRHRFVYAVGLSAATAAENSTILTLVKNYKSASAPSTIIVNPKHASFETETGAICAKMSIIDKLKLTLKFNMTRNLITADLQHAIKFSWMPIFFSFPEKLDAQDDMTDETVSTILALTKDATEEDITPAFSTKTDTGGDSELNHAVSTANFTEVFGTLNLTTNIAMEGVPFDKDRFHQALTYYTNKGALKACIGRTRNVSLTKNFPEKTFFINKFVPRPIRRIVPYTYFGILIHVPLSIEAEQSYYSTAAIGPSIADLGVKCLVQYDEWNPDHNQDMA